MRQHTYSFCPVTTDLWNDFTALFSQPGVQNGCWCMYWRIKRNDFQQQYGQGNKKAMRRLIASGVIPGILAFYKEVPIGWCSVAPRDDFPVLDRSPILKRIDDRPVWSITCFFVLKKYRHADMMYRLVRAAVRYAKQQGARIIEAYPIRPERIRDPRPELYRGTVSVFSKAGFRIVAQRSKTRPIMRYYVASSGMAKNASSIITKKPG